MSNYPPGAENDPRAPYNQKDPETKKCEECNGTGYLECSECGTHSAIECDDCEGTGEIEIDDEDLKAAEGDRAYDAWKDSRLEKE